MQFQTLLSTNRNNSSTLQNTPQQPQQAHPLQWQELPMSKLIRPKEFYDEVNKRDLTAWTKKDGPYTVRCIAALQQYRQMDLCLTEIRIFSYLQSMGCFQQALQNGFAADTAQHLQRETINTNTPALPGSNRTTTLGGIFQSKATREGIFNSNRNALSGGTTTNLTNPTTNFTTNVLGQKMTNSPFGQTPKPTTIFGQNTSTNSVFGQSTNRTNILGQNSNIFGQTANTFGQNTNAVGQRTPNTFTIGQPQTNMNQHQSLFQGPQLPSRPQHFRYPSLPSQISEYLNEQVLNYLSNHLLQSYTSQIVKALLMRAGVTNNILDFLFYMGFTPQQIRQWSIRRILLKQLEDNKYKEMEAVIKGTEHSQPHQYSSQFQRYVDYLLQKQQFSWQEQVLRSGMTDILKEHPFQGSNEHLLRQALTFDPTPRRQPNKTNPFDDMMIKQTKNQESMPPLWLKQEDLDQFACNRVPIFYKRVPPKAP